jgi:hypothetical protein
LLVFLAQQACFDVLAVGWGAECARQHALAKKIASAKSEMMDRE